MQRTSGDLSWCRHCGAVAPMTAEHIPPRSTGNDQPVNSVINPFDLQRTLQAVAEWADGHVVPSLDERCNNRASNWGYVDEYRKLHDLVLAVARPASGLQGDDPLRQATPLRVELPYDVMPARLARQIIGMFLAVQEDEHLFASAQVLVDLIGGDPSDGGRRRRDGLDISPFRLYMSVGTRSGYGTTPMAALTIPLTASPLTLPPGARVKQSELLLLALAPLVFVLANEDRIDAGLDITAWAAFSEHQRLRKSQLALRIPTADTISGALRAHLYPETYVVRPA